MSSSLDDWDRHWRDYAESAERNPAQSYRRKLVSSLLGLGDPEHQHARVLDIGSGQGDMAASLHARFPHAEILGLELSEAAVQIASRKVPTARFVQRDLLDSLAPPDNQCGWATHAVCTEVLEHLEAPRRLLEHARAYMAPGCRLVVTVPGGPMSAFDCHIGHRRHFTPEALQQLLVDAGYRVEMVTGAGFPFFNLYRTVVVMRGQRLIDDVARTEFQAYSRSARLGMALFDFLFRFNLSACRWGWQMVATAQPAEATGSDRLEHTDKNSTLSC